MPLKQTLLGTIAPRPMSAITALAQFERRLIQERSEQRVLDMMMALMAREFTGRAADFLGRRSTGAGR